jgi:hypothetical protein
MALSKFLDIKNDIAFKCIFGNERNKDIVIHFLKDMKSIQDSEKKQSILCRDSKEDAS